MVCQYPYKVIQNVGMASNIMQSLVGREKIIVYSNKNK